jgi:hypothetical protein
MSSHRKVQPLLVALLLALCFVPGATVFASLPWLKQQPDNLVFLITGIAGFVTILASLALSIVFDRRMDEWERSNSRFSSFWGDAAGTSLVALLLCLPAGREWIVDTVANWADAARTDQLVILGFVLGFVAVVGSRVVCMAVLSIGWTLWKSRGAREPS